MIGVIKYGINNLASVKNALDFQSIDSFFIESKEDFAKADKLILPGVGAFGHAMDNLKKENYIDVIRSQVLDDKKPILGICLGMQLLLTESEEHGFHKGLNLIDGKVRSFDPVTCPHPIPHVGWNTVELKVDNELISSDFQNKDYYFVHSFHCEVDEEHVIGTTDYGIEFHSMIRSEYIFGCQFHPEKSQKSGLNIFSQFAQL